MNDCVDGRRDDSRKGRQMTNTPALARRVQIFVPRKGIGITTTYRTITVFAPCHIITFPFVRSDDDDVKKFDELVVA
jgi:hypothetical protein